MASDGALLTDHIGHAASAQIDAADYIVQQVIFIDAHYIKGRLTVFLHRHSHYNAQLVLENRGGINGQVVCFLQKVEKTAFQIFRGAAGPLHQTPVQVIQGNGIKLIDLRGLLQHSQSVCAGCGGVRAGCLRFVQAGNGYCIHPGIASNGHHAVGQHMEIGLHCLG